MNGLVTADGNIAINVNSSKYLNSVVGHEVTHVLEGTELYDALKESIIEYAKTKGEYQTRYDEIAKLYEGIKDANIEKELTADLVGDYLFTDSDFISKLSTEKPNVFKKIFDEIKYLCKVATAGSKEARQLERVKKAFEKAYRETTAEKNTAEGGVRYSINEIIDQNNKSYGIGVKLDSTLLDNLTPKERVIIVKEYVKELGGKIFSAYDNSGNAIDITIAKSKARFKNQNGKSKPVNKDLTSKYIKNEVKQEAIALIDELIITSKYDNSVTPLYSHEWLDNYGNNDWEYWTTYIQDKNNTIWEATLNIANASNGEKILYDIYPIKKAGQSVKSDTSTANNIIPNPTENVKQKQLEIIEKVNPAPNTYNTWIRKVEDIKTLAETLEDSDWADGDEFNPDLTRDMVEEAIESGEITVYSSYPIEQGVFVSPSYMEAASYSGDGNVYEKTVSIDAVAWIDPTQGMYANTAYNYDAQFSLSENLENAEKILYNKNSPLAIVNRAKTAHNSSLKWVYDAEIFSVEESILFHEKISEINQGSQAFSKNSIGEYMIPVENKIIFTDGNYDSPYVREIVEVLTECEDEFQKVRERIFNVEKGKSSKQDEVRIINQMFGAGCIISYNSGNNGVYGWEDGRRKGKTRSSTIRNHLNKQHRGRNDRTSKETQINEIAPIKETSSEDGVFSLSSDSTTSKKYGNFYGADVMLQPSEDIAPVRDDVQPVKQFEAVTEDIAPTRESIAEKKQAAKDNKFPMLDENGIAPVAENSNNESNSIKEQLRSSQDKLNSMETVGKLNDSKVFDSRQDVVGWVLDKIKDAGYKIKRSNFGEIIFDRKRIQNGLRYLKTNDEKLAFVLVLTVLEKGTQIGHYTEHKGRNYDTTTFAAPVEINGVRGNMAVVVRSAGENYYKVHRLVSPDGSQFSFNKKGDIAERVGGA